MRDTMNDDIIRGKLDQYESPVSARNWDVIAEALKKKKRRRFIFWWKTLLPALLLIVAGTGALVWFNPSSKNKLNTEQSAGRTDAAETDNRTKNTNTEKNNSSNTVTITEENKSENNNINASAVEKTINTTELSRSDNTAINKAISNKKINNDTRSADASVLTNNNRSTAEGESSSFNASNSSVSATRKSKARNEYSETAETNTKLISTRSAKLASRSSNKSKQRSTGNIQLSDDNNGNSNRASVTGLSLFSKKKKKEKQNNTASSISANDNETNNEDPDAQNETVMNTELSMQWAKLKWKGFTLAPHFPPPINYDRGRIKCPLMFSPRRNDWYIDVYASPNLSNRSLSNRSNQTALNKKDTSERSTLSFSAGINIAKNIGNSFILRTGINYSLTNEKFSYSRINSIKDIIIITVKKIPIAPGDTTYIYDTTHIQQIGTQLTKATNRYHSIDVPLIFGYETRGEDIRFNINAGVIFNITSIAKGKTLSVADTVVDISSSGYYKTNLGISLFGSVMMLKRVNDRLDLFAEPYYRQGLGNMATDKAFFKQTQSSYGLNLGIRYRFNGRQRR